MILTTQRPLAIKRLIWKRVSNQENNNIWGNEQDTIFTHKSWVSLYTIFQVYTDLFKKKPNVLVPEYYCDDTLQVLRGISNINYYKINDSLDANLKNCNALFKNGERYDFLIVAHFFGKEFDFNDIKEMCRINNIILVEDAVHVLFPSGKIGKYGDIVISSPWKSYGSFDGAILKINCLKLFDIEKQELVNKILNAILAYPVISERTINKWKIKKIVQRIIPDIGNKKIVLDKSCSPVDHYIYSQPQLRQISNFSLELLKCISINEIAELSDRKKEISLSIIDYLSEKYHISPFYDDIDMPYAITISVSNMAEKREIMSELRKIGKICYEWPTLPGNLPSDTNAYTIRDRILCIAVHDGITLERIRKKLKYDEYYSSNRMNVYHFQIIEDKEYDDFSKRYFTPVLQGSSYVNAKKSEQGWRKKLWSIKNDKQIVAVFSVLTKYGFFHRINHGPIYSSEIEETEKIEIIGAIKNKFSGIHGILFFAPNIERTGYNLNALSCMGFKYRKSYYKTGVIDLTVQSNQLRKSLSSKWRNLLNSAEKRGLCVKTAKTMEEFKVLLELHKTDKKIRGYSDSGDNITVNLFKNKAIIPLYVENDQGIVISFIFFALHGSTATYYIGWSNEEGYKKNASRLLLWQGMLMLKEKGIHWFDVGGIDYVHTKGVAEFKEGTGCSIIDYVGEFLAI